MNYPKTGLTVLLCCAGLLAAADNPLELHHYQLDNGGRAQHFTGWKTP